MYERTANISDLDCHAMETRGVYLCDLLACLSILVRVMSRPGTAVFTGNRGWVFLLLLKVVRAANDMEQ